MSQDTPRGPANSEPLNKFPDLPKSQEQPAEPAPAPEAPPSAPQAPEGQAAPAAAPQSGADARPQRPGPGGPGGDRRPPRDNRRRRFPRRKVCYFRASKAEYIDYKDVNTLRRFVSENGKILPRRMTGTSAKFQRLLTTAVKRARYMALLPFSDRHN